MSDLTLGVVTGLLAAAMQSCSYLGGRRFLAKAGDARQLLVASMLICGAAAWGFAAFFWAGDKIWSWRMGFWLLISNGGFVAGQLGFFAAQKHIESSRIASLLGLKVLVVMALTVIFLHTEFLFLQYAAGLGAALAAVLMNWNRGKLDWNGMGALGISLIGYATSDLGIQMVVGEIAAEEPIAGGLQGFVLTYGLLGALALFAVRPLKVTWRMVNAALPQAICWTVSMWGLYICFGLLGAAFGNVIQASRGLISLLLGLSLSFFGIQGLEQRQPWGVWLRRSVAALLMFAAIALYALAAMR